MKQLLIGISNALRTSSQVSWKTGRLSDWTIWAYRMESSILNSIPLLVELANQANTQETRIKELETQLIEKDKVILALATKQTT